MLLLKAGAGMMEKKLKELSLSKTGTSKKNRMWFSKMTAVVMTLFMLLSKVIFLLVSFVVLFEIKHKEKFYHPLQKEKLEHNYQECLLIRCEDND